MPARASKTTESNVTKGGPVYKTLTNCLQWRKQTHAILGNDSASAGAPTCPVPNSFFAKCGQKEML